MTSAPAPSHHQVDSTSEVAAFAQGTVAEQTSDGHASRVVSRFRSSARRTRLTIERGATAVEYALMIGLVAVGIIAALSSLRDKTTDSLNHTAASTAGLIFPARVSVNEPFSVKYIRNDLSVNGWTAIGQKGFTTGQVNTAGVTSFDYLTKNGTEWTATLTAPSTPGMMEVQVRKGNGPDLNTVLETGVIRVVG
jgi:Flp pilus assembly pilin Flp